MKKMEKAISILLINSLLMQPISAFALEKKRDCLF